MFNDSINNIVFITTFQLFLYFLFTYTHNNRLFKKVDVFNRKRENRKDKIKNQNQVKSCIYL